MSWDLSHLPCSVTCWVTKGRGVTDKGTVSPLLALKHMIYPREAKYLLSSEAHSVRRPEEAWLRAQRGQSSLDPPCPPTWTLASLLSPTHSQIFCYHYKDPLSCTGTTWRSWRQTSVSWRQMLPTVTRKISVSLRLRVYGAQVGQCIHLSPRWFFFLFLTAIYMSLKNHFSQASSAQYSNTHDNSISILCERVVKILSKVLWPLTFVSDLPLIYLFLSRRPLRFFRSLPQHWRNSALSDTLTCGTIPQVQMYRSNNQCLNGLTLGIWGRKSLSHVGLSCTLHWKIITPVLVYLGCSSKMLQTGWLK